MESTRPPCPLEGCKRECEPAGGARASVGPWRATCQWHRKLRSRLLERERATPGSTPATRARAGRADDAADPGVGHGRRYREWFDDALERLDVFGRDTELRTRERIRASAAAGALALRASRWFDDAAAGGEDGMIVVGLDPDAVARLLADSSDYDIERLDDDAGDEAGAGSEASGT